MGLLTVAAIAKGSGRASDARASRHHLRNCHEFVAYGHVMGAETVGGFDGMGSIGTHLCLGAVVHQDYVAAANLALRAGDYLVGGGRLPVVTGDIPHDRLKAQFSNCAQRAGPTPTIGWAEDCRSRAARIEDSLLRPLDLTSQLSVRGEDQARM